MFHYYSHVDRLIYSAHLKTAKVIYLLVHVYVVRLPD